jgi:hypothetical protein
VNTGSGASGTTRRRSGANPKCAAIAARDALETVKRRVARRTAIRCFNNAAARSLREAKVRRGSFSTIVSCSPITVGVPTTGK